MSPAPKPPDAGGGPAAGIRVTSVAPDRRHPGRVRVAGDTGDVLSLPMTETAALSVGRLLSPGDWDALRLQDARFLARQTALRLLAARPRSCKEIEDGLAARGHDRTVTEDVVDRLVHEGYIDDDAFAAAWVDWRCRHHPMGRFGLRKELREKGIDPRTAEAAMDGLDETSLAMECLSRRYRKRRRGLDPAERRRAYAFLQRRGFGADVAARCLERFHRMGPDADAGED